MRDAFVMLRRCVAASLQRAAVDVLYGFFVITLPAGVITYQRPPFRFRACPDAVPEAESPTYVYKGHPAYVTTLPPEGFVSLASSDAVSCFPAAGASPVERATGGHTDAHELTHVTLLFLSGAKV